MGAILYSRRREDSKLTASVDLLDRLVRCAPNLTQKLFESTRNNLPDYYFVSAQYKIRLSAVCIGGDERIRTSGGVNPTSLARKHDRPL